MTTLDLTMAYAATLVSSVLALAVLCLRRRSIANWCFCCGMAVLAVDSALGSLSLRAALPEDTEYWQSLSLVAKSFLPGVWLAFSLTYSRGKYREFLVGWRFVLASAFLVPIGLAIGWRDDLILAVPGSEPGQITLQFGAAAKALNGLILIGCVLILMNLERTFRASVGTMRWRMKFLVLGLGVVFGVTIYTRSQALLFLGNDPAWASIETAALLVGCALVATGYIRRGFAEIDVYPSKAVLHSSLTVLLTGAYLLIIGVVGRVIAALGGAGSWPVQVFVVLAGLAVLGVLLLSDRLRQSVQHFVSRHFKRPQHDFRAIWTQLTKRTSGVLNRADFCTAAVTMVSETFNVLAVTIWLVDRNGRLVFGGSTAQVPRVPGDAEPTPAAISELIAHLGEVREPFQLDRTGGAWATPLKELTVGQFPHGGHRICVPLRAGDQLMGVAVLADRVNGLAYTAEELEMLKCIGDQVAAGLLNVRLTGELMEAKELEAFQTMSAFFVHDLKNTTSSLNLMLQNLPVHFNDPAFREDALRGIAQSVNRINDLIARLSSLRHTLELKSEECDLNQLVAEAVETLRGVPEVEVLKNLHPLPPVVADPERFQSVVINLLLNARDAVGKGGRIQVETSQSNGQAVLRVADNGCGMTPAFIQDSLFRPFQTTKKKGLGIGMFQSKMIVEAHRGSIQVESDPDKGTTFRVSLPLSSPAP